MPRLDDGKTFLPKFSFGKNEWKCPKWLFQNKHYYYFHNLKSVSRLVNLKVVCRPCIQYYTRFVWTAPLYECFFLNRTVLYVGFIERARAAHKRIHLSGAGQQASVEASMRFIPVAWIVEKYCTPSLIQHVCFVFHKTVRSYIEIWRAAAVS